MPHLIIESSLTLSHNIVEELHKIMGLQETVSPATVKTRYYKPSIAFSGDLSIDDHTALTVKLLSGRSLELKEQISKSLFDKAKALIEKGSISVEILNLGVYKK